MILHCIWDVFRIFYPFDTTKTWDFFHHADIFTMLTLVSHMEELRKTGDKYNIDNLEWSGEYPRSSMDLPLLTKVLAHVNVAVSGTEIPEALILFINASNFEIMYKVKENLATTKMSVFPGDNFELYYDHQLVLLHIFSGAGFLQPQHLFCLTRPLTRCTSPAFQLWGLNQSKVVSEFCFKTQHMPLSLIPESDFLDFQEIIWSNQSDYKQLFDADDQTSGRGSTTPVVKITLLSGYWAALLTEPVAFQTMMCQAISTNVSASICASAQYNPPPPGWDGGGRGGRGGKTRNPKQVAVPGNCNRCGKAVHCVQDCPKLKTYWYLPPAGTEDNDTKLHCKKGDKSGVTISYCSVCKR